MISAWRGRCSLVSVTEVEEEYCWYLMKGAAEAVGRMGAMRGTLMARLTNMEADIVGVCDGGGADGQMKEIQIRWIACPVLRSWSAEST